MDVAKTRRAMKFVVADFYKDPLIAVVISGVPGLKCASG